MKQDDIDIMMSEIDRKCKLPKHWEEFIEKNSKNHNLIIKNPKTKELYCTNCKNHFVDKLAKVRDHVICPHCNKKYIVYGANYHKKYFEQSVVLVQKMNKQVVIRIFEIYTYFVTNKEIKKRSCVEYARILPGIGRFIGSNVFMNMYGLFRVYHGNKKIYWYKYNGYRFFTNNPTYPYNKKRLVKGTNMEYAPINEFLDRFSYYRYNYLDVLELAAYPSFEFLWNMKLYNLCFYSKKLNVNGNFYKRFGVPKSFLKFMQDNDVSYKELTILQILQKADKELLDKYRYFNINHLRFLVKYNILNEYLQLNLPLDLNKYSLKTLKEISTYVPLKKFIKYNEGLNNLYIYRDYLRMSKELAKNYKSKKDLFPDNLIERHDILQKEINDIEDFKSQSNIYLRYLELSKYTYKDDKYIIFPAPSIDDMKEEGEQQDNCVGYAYVTDYANKITEIFFIRKLNDVCKSFITLEYQDGQVVQKELPHHSKDFTNEQLEFINKWTLYRKFVDKKEKYKNKTKYEVIEYDLKKLVA